MFLQEGWPSKTSCLPYLNQTDHSISCDYLISCLRISSILSFRAVGFMRKGWKDWNTALYKGQQEGKSEKGIMCFCLKFDGDRCWLVLLSRPQLLEGSKFIFSGRPQLELCLKHCFLAMLLHRTLVSIHIFTGLKLYLV